MIMMRRLLLMRHAKSTPSSGGMADHERPLEEKGIDDAQSVGKKLQKRGYEPDTVLCSDSKRTLQTWEQVRSRFPDVTFVKSPDLYESNVNKYQAVLSSQEADAKCILLIGHNPTIEEFIEAFCSEKADVKPAETVVLEVRAPSWEAAFDMKGDWKFIETVKC